MNVLLALRATAVFLLGWLLRRRVALIAVTCLLVGHGTPAFAIASCNAGAGPTVSGGSGDSCGLNKYAVTVTSVVDGGGVGYNGGAATSLISGSQSGSISIFDNLNDGQGPPVANGNFYSNLLVDFTISGPASAAPLPTTLLIGVAGSVAGTCTNCEGQISYSLSLQRGSLLNISVSGGQGPGSDWAASIGSSVGATGSLSNIDDKGFNGALTFDAASLLNQSFRLTASVSGTVNFTGPNPSGASLTADASHTALFNLILPAGYSIVASPNAVPFLTAPVLLVPEPAAASLVSIGLAALSVVAARRRSRRHRG
ncbi:MAG: hypothetical protein K2Y35_16440 [Burkholderiales bacterium]|nr:hypothetical protein [Burkholderiales bacterium]